MTPSRNSQYWKLGLVNALAIASLIAASRDYAKAQIIPDNTLGTESPVVTPNVLINNTPSDQIDGGAIRGSTLFHSFEQFNIDAGRGAYFTSPAGIKNILSRVTGGNRSDILGKLGVLGNADLFLINPNGIIFGPGSSLDVRGSFLATTASSLNFADGTKFSATAPQTTPLLTVSVPVGLQFGETVGSILNQSQPTNLTSKVSGLQVQPGKTLALVGGNITLSRFFLTAQGGRIELGSVAGPSLVSLNSTDKGWIFGYENVQNFQDIELSQRSFVNTIGQDSSNVQLQGRRITVTDGSQIFFINIGAKQAGNLTVNASESVELIGTSPFGVNSGFFGLSVNAGTAGNTIINTKRLLVRDGAFIVTRPIQDSEQDITATGRAGDLIVNASESVELVNGSSLFATTLGSRNAGNVRINTGRLFIQGDKAGISVSSDGTGDAGNIEITARSIQLDNGGELNSDSTSGKGGGNITLRNLDLLQMGRNSEISTNAEGTGMGGNIKIDTDLLIGRENSDITATAVEGRGGNIAINTQGIFGIEPRSRRTSESDITAASDLGIDGIVEINRPDINPSSGLVSLPAEIVDPTRLIAQGCGAGGGDVATSKFIATGRGGLPPSATEALRSDSPLADLGTSVEKSQENRASATTSSYPIDSAPTPLVEAQGWAISSKGKVVLTAQASATSSIPWLTPNTCNG